MPVTTPIAATAEQLDAVTFNADGLVPAIVQEEGTGLVLMMGWMNADTLRMTLNEGRMVFWSRSREETWRKGDTSGDRQYVRRAFYDCDGDTLLFVGRGGPRRVPTGAARASSGVRRERARMITPKLSLDEFRRLAADHSVVPVWTELLADLETPVAAYAKLVGDGEGFLLESVEHGERWSRFSFVGRNPTATLIARDGEIEVVGKARREHPLDQASSWRFEALLNVIGAVASRLRPCKVVSSAIATTSCARSTPSRILPTTASARRRVSVIGSWPRRPMAQRST